MSKNNETACLGRIWATRKIVDGTTTNVHVMRRDRPRVFICRSYSFFGWNQTT